MVFYFYRNLDIIFCFLYDEVWYFPLLAPVESDSAQVFLILTGYCVFDWRREIMRTTYMAKPREVERNWVVVDAAGVPLGRLASEVAVLLRGKHKPQFTPHVDTGDFVIVINAEKVVLTGNKEEQKIYYRHSGWPGGLKMITASEMRKKRPERLVELAVKGMIPKNRLGRQQLKKLKVYAGPEHPHQAQQPKKWELRGLK